MLWLVQAGVAAALLIGCANVASLLLARAVSRERELADIKRLLGDARLLTLLGMGGLGKTRLSLQVSADMLEKFPDGVWFVDLSPLRDPARIRSFVAGLPAG